MPPLRSRSTVWTYICCPSGDHDRRKGSPFSFPVSTSTMAAGADSVNFDASTSGDAWAATMKVSASKIGMNPPPSQTIHHGGHGGHGGSILSKRIVPPVLGVHRGGGP